MTDDEHSHLQNRLVALTRDLMLMPSVPGRPDDQRRCYEFIRNHVEGLAGVEIHDLEAGGKPSLLALPAGQARADVLLVAHLDVVTHPSLSAYRSRLHDGRIIGPGAGDMKGALAICMVLFRRLHQVSPGVSLGLVVTSDEETGSDHGVRFLVEQRNLRCNVALIPDGGSLNRITVEEKGVLHLRVRREGRPSHAARPWLGDNPLEKLIAALGRLQGAFEPWKVDGHHWYPTCAITSVGTENETINRLPAEAHALLDIRFPQPHTTKEMLDLVRGHLGEGVIVETVIGAEATHLDPDPRYAEITREVTGRPAELIRESGGSDARFFTPHRIPVLMSRPLVGNLHAPDEWIDIASMVQFYRICENYLGERLGVTDIPPFDD